jgi:NIMA-interacting peptidyl-prolyl cis-trans isomerase 1
MSQVQCKHILQKHNQSRNPFDRFRNKPVTRTPEEALANIERIRSEIKTAEDFDRLALEYSECGSAEKHGDLGMFGRGQMQAPFEEASFALKVGEMSGIVYTDSGVHIILRTA